MNFLEFRKEVVLRGRRTSTGRFLLMAAAVAGRPLDYYQRRFVAAQYNEKFPSALMTAGDAYALLPSGTIPGTADVIAICRRLFETKQARLEPPVSTGGKPSREQRTKRSFLRNLLDDEDLRANPRLIDFALSDPLFSIVTNYLRVIPSLTSVNLVYSVPRLTSDEFISSQLFHQDPEGLRQAKVFLYVFDVDDDSGPFTFIPATESERVVAAIRRQRRHVGAPPSNRYLDEEVRAQGGLSAAVRVTGAAGAGVIVDTARCLHAGSRVSQGRFRLCFYLQYCTSDEKAMTFDAGRFRNDPVRWLALKRHAVLPRQMAVPVASV